MSKHNSGSYYLKEAQKHGLRVQMGHGDHVKIFAPAERGYMVVPMHRELAPGTECHIRKWFKLLGIVLAFVPMACLASAILSH